MVNYNFFKDAWTHQALVRMLSFLSSGGLLFTLAESFAGFFPRRRQYVVKITAL